jgi:(1->4)-alpha-D-glucan 1-alpha-D-glucosylmutase
LAVLSEVPASWERSIRRWAQLNTRRRRRLEQRPVPDRNEEYFIYQALVGTWPLELRGERDPAVLSQYVERLEAYVIKALREAKIHSSWVRPNEAYESATLSFVRHILDDSHRSPFLDDFTGFVRAVARFGMYNSLAQTVLRLMGPGVPDTYRGCELWDFTFVDPDNRRPVDYELRRRMLSSLPGVNVREMLDTWTDGRLKLLVMQALLRWRRERPASFAAGAYRPIDVSGRFADHVCAFAMGEAVVVAPRLIARMTSGGDEHPIGTVWNDTALVLTDVATFRNVITGETVQSEGGVLSIAAALRDIPVAVLEPISRS